MKKILIGMFFVSVLSWGGFWIVQARETGSPLPPPQGPMKPPPEAIAACKGKSKGASVQFTTPRGDTLQGVCKEFEGALTAMPPHGGPPPSTQGMKFEEGGMDNSQSHTN
jgi:hypothetical protein